MYRKFEGEEDRNHHGPAPNALFSSAHNMRTNIMLLEKGRGSTDDWKLRRANEEMELGLSQVGGRCGEEVG